MTDDWLFLKEKCVDCYELNRYREIENSVSGYIDENKAILDIRYCPTHEASMEELRRIINRD